MHVSTGPLRSVPGYAFPFTQQTEHIQKRARLQSVDRVCMLTLDAGESAAFSGFEFFLLPPVPPEGYRTMCGTVQASRVHSTSTPSRMGILYKSHRADRNNKYTFPKEY